MKYALYQLTSKSRKNETTSKTVKPINIVIYILKNQPQTLQHPIGTHNIQ